MHGLSWTKDFMGRFRDGTHTVKRAPGPGRLPSSAQNELKALSEFKEHQSTGTPILVDYFHSRQSANMCVPGSFLLIILMTYCPGVPVLDFRSKPLAEREEIRQAFRIAYEYALLCT